MKLRLNLDIEIRLSTSVKKSEFKKALFDWLFDIQSKQAERLNLKEHFLKEKLESF